MLLPSTRLYFDDTLESMVNASFQVMSSHLSFTNSLFSQMVFSLASKAVSSPFFQVGTTFCVLRIHHSDT